MKNTKRNLFRQAARPCKGEANLRDKLEKTLLKVCADIGWICGWRKERMIVAPVARRSSRRRVMLGRAGASPNAQAESAFGSVETKFVSTGRAAQAETGLSDAAVDLPDLVLEAQDEIVRQLSNAADVAQLLSHPRVRMFRQQLAQRWSLSSLHHFPKEKAPLQGP